MFSRVIIFISILIGLINLFLLLTNDFFVQNIAMIIKWYFMYHFFIFVI
jgi:hypothetical protein